VDNREGVIYSNTARKEYLEERIRYWDSVAIHAHSRIDAGAYYRKYLAEVYKGLIPPGCRVLEIGCGKGDLLDSLKPGFGMGIDISFEAISRAKSKYPHLGFLVCDVEDLGIGSTFDYIILSDLVNDLWDVQKVFEQIAKVSDSRTRIIINLYSRLWEPALLAAQRLRLCKPNIAQNWLTVEDITNLLYLVDFEVIRCWQEMLVPFDIPIVSRFANRYLVKVFPFTMCALSNIVVARQTSDAVQPMAECTVSIIVPARNEAGNIREILQRTPSMGRGTEFIFVEGHSQDDTYAVIEKTIAEFSDRQCRLLRQIGEGKADAVRIGFSHASGDVLIILDADVTVAPEDLEKFYRALVSGKAELVNGVRHVYPMGRQAMRFLNLVVNKLFSFAFSWVIGQHIKDILCGTKALFRKDYDRISKACASFGIIDPFGDFELILGSAKLNLKITDIPVRYRRRIYGKSNIRRWRHGWMLVCAFFITAIKIKFTRIQKI